ncbi:lytic transglycosylase domain-containing protein, partial [Bartonella sp. TP]
CTTILKYNAGYGAKKMNPISQRYCEKVRTYLASLK